jgi:pyroglutamyl-peptidase
MIRVLVMGFGPFGAVVDNPAARLARAVDGAERGPVQVVGRTMDVAWERCWTQTRTAVERCAPRWLIGVGVATQRSAPAFEAWATNALRTDSTDVDGVTRAQVRADGPDRLAATLQLRAPDVLGVERSDDAGRYVCNMWLYQAIDQAPPGVAVAFLHVPARGFEASDLLDVLELSAGWSKA